MFKAFFVHIRRLLLLFLSLFVFLVFFKLGLTGFDRYKLNKDRLVVEERLEWYVFRSLEYGFKTAFLGYPDHLEDKIGVFNSSTLMDYDTYTYEDEVLGYSQKVSVITYPADIIIGDTKELLELLMNQFSNNHAPTGELVSFSPFKLGKYGDPALDFHISDDRFDYHYRLVGVVRSVYVLLTVSPIESKKDITTTFFDTFELF